MQLGQLLQAAPQQVEQVAEVPLKGLDQKQALQVGVAGTVAAMVLA